MEKETYTSQTSNKRLQEAIEADLQESDDNECYLAIIPHDPSALTDEEKDADEDMAACLIPPDVPGTIEVFMNREGSGDEDIVYDESDDELLLAKKKTTRSIYSEPKLAEMYPFILSSFSEYFRSQ
ncbi:unnamed protein product [Arctia plantaginis]|uniref:Uncharacterized protein n=1 Tax=Arctia plantaginis TaxID=874455 RepID=A0A8S1A435_ARCPL|nr:unnamed protein product [Arctia plantaginis]